MAHDESPTVYRDAYEALPQTRVDGAVGAAYAIAQVIDTTGIRDLYRMQPEITVYHGNEIISQCLQLVDPSLLILLRKDFHKKWKKTAFRVGKKVPEGSLMYDKYQFMNEDNLKLYISHKDFVKAYMMFKMLPEGFQDTEAWENAQCFTSAGFHQAYLGRPQKSHSARAPDAKNGKQILMGEQSEPRPNNPFEQAAQPPGPANGQFAARPDVVMVDARR